MATDSARSTAPPAARQLWQVPVFFLGIAALVAVPLLRPYWKTDHNAIEWQLRAARSALEQSPPDLAQAVQRGLRVLDAVDHFPDLAAEAHFVVGSARLRLADEPGADSAHERQQARQHLEQAESRGVAPDDQAKLQYRLAKVWLLSGAEAPPVVAALEKSIESADDPAEGYGLLAQAYLRLNPPDPTKALEATKRQLDRLRPSNDTRLLAQARFRLGELYFQLKNVKDGRQMLLRVDETAPPELIFAAKALLAQSYEESEEWEQATRNWERAKQNSRLTPAEKGRLLYHLGHCYAQEQRAREAAAVWEEALALGGDEAQAAGLRLAGLKLDADAPPAAVEALGVALGTVLSPGDYHNSLVPLDEARQLLERAARQSRSKGEWATAQTVAELYGRLAPPSGADVMAGLTADEWAKALFEQAQQAPPEHTPALEEQARAQLRAAGLAYEKAAGKVAAGPEQANWLDNSANRLIRAKDFAHAAEVLNRFVQLEGAVPDEQLAKAWFSLAQTHHFLNQYAAARAAYQHCLKPNGPFLVRARLELARIDLVEGRFDDAERALQENNKLLLEASQPDAALKEQTLFALGEVAYQRQEAEKREELREYVTTEQRLLGALQQYPEGSAARRARLMLALCYWNKASFSSRVLARAQDGVDKLNDEEREKYKRQQNENLQKSADQCDLVEKQLLAKLNNGRLSAEDETNLKRASYMGAECYFWMLKQDEVVRRYGVLALRYQHHPEELIARSQLWQYYQYYSNKPDLAREQFRQIREAVDKWPEAAFEGSQETHKRTYWTSWLAQATSQMPSTTNAAAAPPAPLIPR